MRRVVLALLAGLRALAQGPDHALCFDTCDLVDRGVVGGMDATLRGSATCVPETGLVCDGSNGGYANLNDVELGGAMTIEVWARWDALRWSSPVFDFGDGPDAHNIVLNNYEDTSIIGAWAKKEDGGWVGVDAGDIALESWTHLVVTIDDVALKLFQNGELVGTADAGGSAPPLMPRANHYLCKPNWSADDYLDGAIASLRIWSRVLSLEEVTALYATPVCESWPTPAPTVSPVPTVTPAPSPLPTSAVISAAAGRASARFAFAVVTVVVLAALLERG